MEDKAKTTTEGFDEQIVKLVKRFNSLNGTFHRGGAPAIQSLVKRAIDKFGLPLVEELIVNVKSDDIYKVLDMFAIKEYLVKKGTQQPTMKEVTPITTPTPTPTRAQDAPTQSTMTLGLIEQALAKVMLEQYAPQVAANAMEQVKKLVAEQYGTIKRQVELKILDKVVMKETVHEQFEKILQLTQIGKAVYLRGPAGSGKNVIAKQVAKALEMKFYFDNAVQQPYQLTGFIDAMGKYQETQFYKSFTDGGVYFLDELDASNPEIVILLNAALANGYFTFPNGYKEAHKDFKVIAAGNTTGQGATSEYNTRQQLDGATLNRFIQIEIDYSEMIENSLTTDYELLAFLRAFRNGVKKTGQRKIVSYREIINLRDLTQLKWTLKDVINIGLLSGMDKDDVNMIYNEMSLTHSNKYFAELRSIIVGK
jgi:cobaltochelatase CobS